MRATRAQLATVAGGERTSERARGPHPQFRTEPAAAASAKQRLALPTRQVAGEARVAMAGRKTNVRREEGKEEWRGEEEEEEEEYCWSSEDEDAGEATMDASMMETIRVQPRRQWWPAESGGVESDGAEMRSWDRTRTVAARSPSNLQDSILARISTLKALCDQGFISVDEYERRKNAIMDELTFNSRSTDEPTETQRRKSFRRPEGLPMIVPHLPDFRDSVPEVAIKHVFNYETREWSSKKVFINLDETPFSKGSLRVVYHLQDLGSVDGEENIRHRQRRAMSSPPPGSAHRASIAPVSGFNHRGATFVAKLAIDPDEDPQTYFRDIELQAHCAFYAQVYNSYHPPKRVEFIKAWVLELTERSGALCAVEPYISGEYRKHNNNFGSVSDDERNTPQAFSHFTYEASNHELLAVDIQGVGDLYTDPQIHTLNGNDFGKGNLGVLGFQKFLSSHRCNSICRYLKLPPVNPKERHADSGTLPVQELMNRDRVRPTHFDSKHYYESAPMLQKYVAQCRALEIQQRSVSRQESPTISRFFARFFCCW